MKKKKISIPEQIEEEFDDEEYDDIPFIDDAENVLIKRTGSKISKIKRPTSTTSLVSAVSNEDGKFYSNL